MNARQLEAAALDAHRTGQTWQEFWAEHGNDARAMEPWNTQRFHALLQRLMGLVVSGDCDGQQPPDARMPWEVDEAASPHDTETRAKFDWDEARV